MNKGFEKEKIVGKHRIIVALITAVTAIITSLIGALLGAKYAPVEVNVNLDSYVSRAQDEIVSKQTADAETELNDLQKTITDLQNDNASQKQQIAALEEEREGLLDTITEKDHIIDALSQTAPSDVPSAALDQATKDAIKLTSLTILGNNEGNYNYVYNGLENSDDAKSNLGEAFNSSISMRRNGNIDFYLGNLYQTLNATISISESTKNISNFSSTLTIYNVSGNGSNETLEVLYTSPSLTMGFIPTEIGPINVSEVEHLRISFYADGYFGDVPRIVLGNPLLNPQ